MTQELAPIRGHTLLWISGFVFLGVGLSLLFFDPAVKGRWRTSTSLRPASETAIRTEQRAKYIASTPKPRLIKTGVYIVNKRIGRLGSGIDITLSKVEVLDDRSSKIHLLFQHNLNSDTRIYFKNPDGTSLTDNLANIYIQKDHSAIDSRLFLGPFAEESIALSFPPLKENITSLTFKSSLAALRSDGSELNTKIEYRLQ